jgi:PAS domain S-box-containing protein
VPHLQVNDVPDLFKKVSVKLLVYVIISFILTTVGVLLTANYRIEKVINQSQTALYEERLNAITNVLSYHLDKLQATGWREEYEEDFQNATLQNLRSTFYGPTIKPGYPIIIDGTGTIILHPQLETGNRALQGRPEIALMLGRRNGGNFDFVDEKGQKQWVIFQYFSEWDWIVAYTIPLKLKYFEADRLRNDLLLIMTLIVCVVVTILSLLIRRMISPITELTKAAVALASGENDFPISVKRNDEIGTLAVSFVRMRNSIRDKIHELATKNEALLESEGRLRLFIDQAADAVFVHDFQGRIQTVNQQACEILGYNRDELLKMSIADIDIDASQEKLENLWNRLRTEKKITSEGMHKRKDGTTFSVEISIGILEAKNHQLILALARDITFRKDAVRNLKESEDKLRRVIEKSPIAMAVTTPDGKITSINKKFIQVFGYTDKDLPSLDYWFPRAYPDPSERKIIEGEWLDSIEKYFKTGVFKAITATVHCQDDSLKDIEFYFEAVGNQYITSFVDISERNKVRNELIKEKEFSEHIINSMPGVFFIYQQVKDHFLLKKWNLNHATLLGYSEEELKDSPIECFFKTDDIPRLNALIAQLLRQGNIETELEILKQDGTSIPCYLQAVLFSKADETFIVGNGLDLSELKQAENERHQLQRQLVQAQKMEAIGTLAGGIAHDFNNILSAIIGYTELSLMITPKDNQVSGYLNNLMKAGIRAKELVQQILAFSRQTEHELKPVLVKAIVKEALRLLNASLPSSIVIKEKIESDLLIMGDPTQIHQIVMNLCTNAGHAMRETGGVLSIELTHVALDTDTAAQFTDLKPGPYVNLTVSDTGHGMTAKVLERIFDPFFTTKEKGEGTGMGLAVVHGIVKSLGGTIYAYSEPGKGSSFKMFLPAIEPSQESGLIAELGQSFPEGTERILFVDDEADLVAIGKQMLENLGYQVVAMTSSQEALDLFQQQSDQFDLVITDMTMPQLQGDKFAENLITIRPDIPIILCTGFSHRITEEKLKGMSFKGLLMKPIIRSELAILVRKILDEATPSPERVNRA